MEFTPLGKGHSSAGNCLSLERGPRGLENQTSRKEKTARMRLVLQALEKTCQLDLNAAKGAEALLV